MEPKTKSKTKKKVVSKTDSTKILINNRKNLMILKKKLDEDPENKKQYVSDWSLSAS